MSSRLVRSIFAAAAAACLLIAPTALAAAPEKDASADAKAAKKDSAKKDAAKDKSAKDKAKRDGADKPKKDVDKKDVDKKGADKPKKDAEKKAKSASKGDTAKADARLAKRDDPKKDDPKKDDVKGPASIGAPNKGRVAGAIKLHASRSLKLRDKAHAWGVPALVKLLQRAAGKVAKRHPKSVMLVGDLSRKAGGALDGHNSHQSGRDADVGFYVANSKGKPAAMKRFVTFDGTGKSSQVTWAQFDDARNWTLVEALLTDKETAVRYVFVSSALRARVLAYAAKKKVAKDLYAKAESTLRSPRDVDVHDDHFHVRIACPDSMKTCIEESLGRANTAPVATASGSTTSGGAAPVAAASVATTTKASTEETQKAGDVATPAQ